MNMKNFLYRVVYRIHESLSIAALGDGMFLRVLIFFKLFFRTWRRPIYLRLRVNGTSISLHIRFHEELMLLQEIFCRRIYDFSSVHNARFVIDCGANCGISTLFLYTLFPNAKILALEPNPELFSRLKEMVSGYTNITPLQCAVGGTNRRAFFFVSPHTTVASSLIRRSGSDTEYSVSVKTLETIMDENNFPTIDALKFDIEGAEGEMFSFFSRFDALGAFCGEVHEDLMKISTKDLVGLIKDRFEFTITPTRKKGRYIMYGHKR